MNELVDLWKFPANRRLIDIFVGERTSSIDEGQKATPRLRDFCPSGLEIDTLCH